MGDRSFDCWNTSIIFYEFICSRFKGSDSFISYNLVRLDDPRWDQTCRFTRHKLSGGDAAYKDKLHIQEHSTDMRKCGEDAVLIRSTQSRYTNLITGIQLFLLNNSAENYE